MTKTPATDAFWQAYRQAAGLDHDRYDIVAFGDSAAMSDELAELVLAGIKRATAVSFATSSKARNRCPGLASTW